jgi:hypothetical protein
LWFFIVLYKRDWGEAQWFGRPRAQVEPFLGSLSDRARCTCRKRVFIVLGQGCTACGVAGMWSVDTRATAPLRATLSRSYGEPLQHRKR